MHRGRLVLIRLAVVFGVLLSAGVAAADGTCGDGTCDPGENCGNCSNDCGCTNGKLCEADSCACPWGTIEDDDGSCRSVCDTSACETWDAWEQRCVSCENDQEYCDHQLGRCFSRCNSDQCQEKDANGECVDRCPSQGRVCNGMGGCICAPGEEEYQGQCLTECLPANCEYRGDDGECHDYCVESGAACGYTSTWGRVRSACSCERCDRPNAQGFCEDICPPMGAVCVEVDYDPGWGCRCPEGTEMVNLGDESPCKPICSAELCEEHDPTTGDCRDKCAVQGKTCLGGTCVEDCAMEACESDDGFGGCSSYCVGGEVCDGAGSCNCPGGTNWNGYGCSPSCDPYNCESDNGAGACSSWCSGGTTCNAGSCDCPPGTYWGSDGCVPSCDSNQCEYDTGSGSCASWCGGGQSCDGTGGCYCPSGTSWDGSSCVPE